MLKVDEAIASMKSSILIPSQQSDNFEREIKKGKKPTYDGMEDGLKMFRLYRRFLKIEYSMTITFISYLILLIAYYESDIKNQQIASTSLIWTMLGVSLVLSFCSILRFQSRKSIAKMRKQEQTSMLQLFLEITLLVIQPYPFFNQIYVPRRTMNQQELKPLKFNHILIILSFPKLLFLLRGILSYLTSYGNPRYYRVNKMYGMVNNYHYQIKCLFKQHPVISISLLYLSCLLIFAYCYRIFQFGAGNGSRLQTMNETMWLAILTMTTVGYGDLKPMTQMGGYITIVSSYIGVIGTSLFVLSITYNLELKYGQQRALQILKRFQYLKTQKIKSAEYIRLCLWRIWQQKKTKKKLPISPKQRQLRRQISQIRLDSKNNLKESSQFQQGMQQQFQIVKHHLNSILQNCQLLVQRCTEKQLVIEGVLDTLQQEKSRLNNNRRNNVTIQSFNKLQEGLRLLQDNDAQQIKRSSCTVKFSVNK